MTSATLLTPATSSRPGGDRPGKTTRAAERAYIRVLVVLDTAVLAVAILVGYLAPVRRRGADRVRDPVRRGRPGAAAGLARLAQGDAVLRRPGARLRRGRVPPGQRGEHAAGRRYRHRRVHRRRRRLPGFPGHLLRRRHRRPGGGAVRGPQAAAPGPRPGRRLVAQGARGGRHGTRAGAGAHAAPGAVRGLPGGRRVHPGRAARPGAAAAGRRAGGRLLPGHPGGGHRDRRRHGGGHRLR